MNIDNIPLRGKADEASIDDSWDIYADQQKADLEAKAQNAVGSKPPVDEEDLIGFIESARSDSIWDNPKLQGFFSFVSTKIDQMADFKRDIQDINSVTFHQLNAALYNHNETYNALVSLYNVAAIEEDAVKLDFQLWFDELYTKMRARLNPPNLSSQKWASTREIESAVRTENKEEFKQRRMNVIAAERQTAFCRRLMEGWDGMKFNLNTISKNQQAQFRGAGDEERYSF